MSSSSLLVIALASLTFAPAPPAEPPVETEVPFSEIVSVPCAHGGRGELVEISGTLFNRTEHAENHPLRIRHRVQASGKGLTSGDLYLARETLQRIENDGSGFALFGLHVVENIRLFGPRKKRLMTRLLVHLLPNNHGEPTVLIQDFDVECR